MDKILIFQKFAYSISELYEKKNKCYGDSFSDTYKKLGLISAVTRISDKTNRLCTLAKNPNIDNLNESIEDTLMDLASYAIMTLMEIHNDKLENIKAILKGDRFLCTRTVTIKESLTDDAITAYVMGKFYSSERDGCITDEQKDSAHEWNEDDDINKYFKRVIPF